MVYPHKWSPISYRPSVGQGKFAGQRPASTTVQRSQQSCMAFNTGQDIILANNSIYTKFTHNIAR